MAISPTMMSSWSCSQKVATALAPRSNSQKNNDLKVIAHKYYYNNGYGMPSYAITQADAESTMMKPKCIFHFSTKVVLC